MAITADAVWEIRADATAGNVNGGFFKTGATGTDFSQQAAAQYNLTGVTTAGADAILLDANAAAVMVGNAAHIISGTNFTAGWYEIISVVAGVSITLDRACTSAAGADGVVNIGGAISLAAANDDAVFENAVAGQKFWVKQGSYTIGGIITMAAAGTATVPILMEGYATTRGDKPTGATRPLITNNTGTTITVGAYWKINNVSFYGLTDGFVLVTSGISNVYTDCKFNFATATGSRAAVYGTADVALIRCELICTSGRGVNTAGTFTAIGCYFHDSAIGLISSGSTHYVVNCLFDTFSTGAVWLSSASNATDLFYGNTFYGAETPAGYGILLAASSTDVRLLNNIIYGFVTGVEHGTVGQNMGVDMFNAYYNNTTNATNWTLGVGSITTAITLTSGAAGDFTPTSANVKSTGLVGIFPGATSTGYIDIGAVQTQYGLGAASGGGAGFPTFTI